LQLSLQVEHDLRITHYLFAYQLQVSTSEPFLKHPVTLKPVYVIIDVPHCLKNARNALMKNDVMFDGDKVATWQHLTDFYESDRSRSLRLASRLSDSHFSLPMGQKMRVSLAAQVLSHSVSSGIRTLVHHHVLEAAALQTADFVQRVNDLFDMLNSVRLYDKGFKQPICRGSLASQSDQLREFEAFLQSWQFQPRSGRAGRVTMKFKEAWCLSIAALRHLCTMLIQEEGFDFVYTRRLTQDHVEVGDMTFSTIKVLFAQNEIPTIYIAEFVQHHSRPQRFQ
jgi:hypothetical protein